MASARLREGEYSCAARHNLSGHPKHVLPVEINILGFLAGKGTDAQKNPPSARSMIGV
jgi:hypothetical protein